jgi:hypothetical protein
MSSTPGGGTRWSQAENGDPKAAAPAPRNWFSLAIWLAPIRWYSKAARHATAAARRNLTMFQALKEWYALSKFKRTPIAQALRAHTQFYFDDTILQSLAPEAKQQRIAELTHRLGTILSSPNPFLAYRSELVEAAFGYADLQVLCLLPHEKNDVTDSPYISGELHKHIRACKEHNDDVARIMWELPELANEELITALNVAAVIRLYHLNGLNIARGLFEPDNLDDPKDWFKPLVKSVLIFAEQNHRLKLELPSLCDKFGIEALEHMTFTNFVRDGHNQPLFEWERHYKKVHAEVS